MAPRWTDQHSWRRRASLGAVAMGAFALISSACSPPTPTEPNNAPVAVAEITPVRGYAPLRVDFKGSDSFDVDGFIHRFNYSWSFGDGQNRFTPDGSMTYAQNGVYTATLTVFDNDSGVGTASVEVTVSDDLDGDGVDRFGDCNDNDTQTFPGADDEFGDGVDQDCDGVDGDAGVATFVHAADGQDTPSCGAIELPCASVDIGQDRAIARGTTTVLIAGGDYPKFAVREGLEVLGGYGQNWLRGDRAVGATETRVVASDDGPAGPDGVDGPVAVVATSIDSPTRVSDLTAVGATGGVGQTSYGLVVTDSNSDLTLESVTVLGGVGGAGQRGTDGVSAPQSFAAGGQAGQNSYEDPLQPNHGHNDNCDSLSRAAGGAGVPGAGSGGDGGRRDVKCYDQTALGQERFVDDRGAESGRNGGWAVRGPDGTFALGGRGGLTLSCGSLANGLAGENGANGTSGPGGSPGVAQVGELSGAGGVGGAGTAGRPGGGGGGGAGCDDESVFSPGEIDDVGGGGGGGGAGGAGAPVGPTERATGGSGGARSIAVQLVRSSPTIVDGSIVIGIGGRGGDGGSGGLGQPGGRGGSGGAANCLFRSPAPCEAGGEGGGGGRGGHGGLGGGSGAGGGGAGGAAVGERFLGGSAPVGSFEISGGTVGAGGAGGTTGAQGLIVSRLTS